MYGGRFIPWRDRAPPEASGLPDLVQDFWHKGSFGNGQRGAPFALARKCRTEPLRRVGEPVWRPLYRAASFRFLTFVGSGRHGWHQRDRKRVVEGMRVSVRVNLGVPSIIQ